MDDRFFAPSTTGCFALWGKVYQRVQPTSTHASALTTAMADYRTFERQAIMPAR